MTAPLKAPIPRIALTTAEAAAALGVGETHFNTYIRPDLRLVRRGRKVMVPVRELERWIEDNADRPIADQIR